MEDEGRQLTHLNELGEAHMVDISEKVPGPRSAKASGIVRCEPETVRTVATSSAKKGDVLAAIRIAGIQGAKKTPEIIPLAHPIAVHAVTVGVELGESSIRISAEAKTSDATGIEMEALTAVACAALTAIDMVKGIDRGAHIERIWLEEKIGGRSGEWAR